MSCYLKVGHVKISEDFTTTLLKTCLFFSVVFIVVDSLLPPLNTSMYSRPLKLAAPPLQPLAVPRLWRNAVLAGFSFFLSFFLCLIFFPKDGTGDNLMVRGQNCRVDAATLCIQNL